MILFDDAALGDLERIFSFNRQLDHRWALKQLETIRTAILVLEEHPRIGRVVAKGEIRELVISVGKAGYLALYQWAELDDLVRVLAVRQQREAGYRGR